MCIYVGDLLMYHILGRKAFVCVCVCVGDMLMYHILGRKVMSFLCVRVCRCWGFVCIS